MDDKNSCTERANPQSRDVHVGIGHTARFVFVCCVFAGCQSESASSRSDTVGVPNASQAALPQSSASAESDTVSDAASGSLRLCLTYEEQLIDKNVQKGISTMAPNTFRLKANQGIAKSTADSVDAGLAPALARPFAAAVIASLRWPIGATLRVRFFNGEPALQQRIIEIANDWSVSGRIRFVLSRDADAEIRVRLSATENTSWSRLGRAGADYFRSPDSATMLLGMINMQTSPDTLRALVLHEFGHSLGLVHEHQHPSRAILWNEPATISYYWRTFGWREDAVRQSVFSRYAAGDVQAGTYDPESIMHYPVPASLTLNRRGVPFNTRLSDLDHRFIGLIY